MRYYYEINLPAIPDELLNFEYIPATVHKDTGWGVQHVKNGRQLNACQYSYGQIKDPALITWLTDNINGLDKDNIYQQVVEPPGSTFIVHSDVYRKYALNYHIDTGGDAVATSWFKEHNKPLRRSKAKGMTQSDSGFVDYANCDILDSVVFKPRTWYLMSTDVLHDVDHLTRQRRSITIGTGLSTLADNDFLKKLLLRTI